MNKLIPLYYAIIKHFLDGKEDCAQGVIAALDPLYHGYKMLNLKDVEEALATARENGLLEETRSELDPVDELRIYYQVTDFGRDMMERYIGKYDNPA